MHEGKHHLPGSEGYMPPDLPSGDVYGQFGQGAPRDPRKTAAIAAGAGVGGAGYLYARGISFPDEMVAKHKEGLRRLVHQRGFWGNVKAGAKETPRDIGRVIGAAHRGLSNAIFNRINKMSTKHDRLVQLNSRLERIINFDDNDNHLLRNTALLGGAGVAGAGGLYTAGALKAGVKPSNLVSNLVKNVRTKGLSPVGSRIMTGGKSALGYLRGLIPE